MDHLFILFIAFIYVFVCIDTRQADPINGYGYSILAAESQCARDEAFSLGTYQRGQYVYVYM